MLLGHARVKAWSHVERATRNPGKLPREVGDGKPTVFGFEAGPWCSEPCCVHGSFVHTQPNGRIPRACFLGTAGVQVISQV